MLKKFFIVTAFVSIFNLSTGLEISHAATTNANQSHWAYPSVQALVSKGYIQEKQNYSTKLTRGEVSIALARFIKEEPAATFKLKASDINSKASYYYAVRKLVAAGILTNSEKIRPNDQITRAEVAKMIMMTFQIQEDVVNSKSFKDISKTHWARTFIYSLADLSIINGNLDNTFKPNGNITFAEFAVLLSKSVNYEERCSNDELLYNYVEKNYIDTKNYYASYEQQIVQVVNSYRTKAGLQPLALDKKLTQLANVKVQDMLRLHYFDHKSPTFNMPWDLAGQFDYEFVTFGENLARNYKQAKDVVDAWYASPAHKANLLKDNYQYVGIGINKDATGTYYISALFSGK